MNSANSPPRASVPESASPLDPSALKLDERLPLPAPAAPAAPSGLAGADRLLACLVVLLAFLVASTPARNSDVWLHLATGRALADGGYRFHGDPSNSGAAHSWLSDLAGYGVYQTLGGGALVFLKASLVALLAALLVRLAQRERGLAWPVVCATLALLALLGRLLLQPALISALLLAGTLTLLQRGRRVRAEHNGNWLRAYGPICLLFALWANLDEWFLLGPLTVGLCLLGEVVASLTDAKTRTDRTGLALLLGAGSITCLLTPFHVHGFTLPPELGLSATARALAEDPVLQGTFVSPFASTYFRAGAAWSVPGLAYLALAVLSGLSFAGSREGWRSWRLPVWLGLFGLSAWSVRAVPFFAVAAGPILALNLQDLLRRSATPSARLADSLTARLGRAAAILLLLGLLVAAWPGWLQGPPYEMRRWTVLADPSLEAAGRQLADWHSKGLLGAEDRGFHFSPEEANYFAWFCPAEKGAVDSRLCATAEEAADYVAVRRALLHGLAGKSGWRDLLREHGVNHLVVYDSNYERLRGVYGRLVSDSEEWSLLFLRGRTAVFAWVDPERPAAAARLTALRSSPSEEAYHPREGRRAPRDWPGRGPRPAAWWQAFVTARPAGSPDRDEAALRLVQFQARIEPTLTVRGLAWEANLVAAAAGTGAASLPAALGQTLDLLFEQALHPNALHMPNPRAPTLEHVALALRDNFFQQQDDAPPELLWLAIRAARRAVRLDPDDAPAYLILGQTYLALSHNTRERLWTKRLPYWASLRQVQASAALNQALLLQPDSVATHLALFTLYQDLGMWDMKLKHLREALRLREAQGSSPGESRAEWQERLTQFQEDVRRLEADVKYLNDSFEVNAAKRNRLDRAEIAREMGLAGKALDLLLATDVAPFGRRGVYLELQLLLATGRVRDVREWLLPEHREILGEEDYVRVQILLAAACGDYEPLDAHLAELAAIQDQTLTFEGRSWSPRQLIALGIGQHLLEERSRQVSVVGASWTTLRLSQFSRAAQEMTDRLRRGANVTVLRGVMALEGGDTVGAEELFRRALAVYQSADSAASGAGLDFSARPTAEHILRQFASPLR